MAYGIEPTRPVFRQYSLSGGNRSPTCTPEFHRPSRFQDGVPLSTGCFQLIKDNIGFEPMDGVLPRRPFTWLHLTTLPIIFG